MSDERTSSTIRIHPLAASLPRMSPDELADLADDIGRNGQREPILLDADGILLDGRHRLDACEMAGVKPRFETYTGDPVALIMTANLFRRHMTQGQRAMWLAMQFPEPRSVKITGVSESSVSHARTVLAADKHLAQAVMDGSKALADAYEPLRLARRAETIRAAASSTTEPPKRTMPPKQEAPSLHATSRPIVTDSPSLHKAAAEMNQRRLAAEVEAAGATDAAKVDGTYAMSRLDSALQFLGDDFDALANLPELQRRQAEARIEKIISHLYAAMRHLHTVN